MDDFDVEAYKLLVEPTPALSVRGTRPVSKMKPNTRFLRHIVREAKSHNAALLARETADAQKRLKRLMRKDGDGDEGGSSGGSSGDDEEDKKSYRKRKSRTEDSAHDEDRHRRRRRQTSGDDDGERDVDDRNRRSHHHHRSHHRSRSHHRDSSGEDREREREKRGRDREGKRSHRHNRKEGEVYTEDQRSSKHKHRQRSESPSQRSRRRSESPRRSRHHHRDRDSDRYRSPHDNGGGGGEESVGSSDPLDEFVGPKLASDRHTDSSNSGGIHIRGRGALSAAASGASSSMDRHFAADYDPFNDVEHPPPRPRPRVAPRTPAMPPLSSSAADNDASGNTKMQGDRKELLRDSAERLRAAGFTDKEIAILARGGRRRPNYTPWAKNGEAREWDRDKVEGDDGPVKPVWAR